MSQNITEFFSPINEINIPPSDNNNTPEPEVIALDSDDDIEVPVYHSLRKHSGSLSLIKIGKKKARCRISRSGAIKKPSEKVNKKAKENLIFNKSWQIGRPWLVFQQTTDDEKGVMFCSLCKEAKTNSSIWSTTRYNYMKVDYVK